VAGKPFIVDVALVDSWGNASPTAGTAVTLAKTGATPGTLTAPPVTTGSNGGASFAASYSDAANPLGLLATAGSFAAPGSTTITSTGTSADLTPNTPAVLAVGGTTANLGNGGRGPAFLFSQPCTNVDTATNCGTRTTEVTLEGSFKDANGVALYGFNTPARPLKPASLSFICAAAVCPHADSGEPRTDYLYNSPAVDPGPYSQADVNEFEQVEDFNRWPLQFAIKNNDGNYPTNLDGSIAFANAPSCVDLDPAHAGITGVIQSQAAQTAGFCLDVYALSRTANGNGVQQFSGDLTRTILFVEDPKARTP
jgi:hypothetical protein